MKKLLTVLLAACMVLASMTMLAVSTGAAGLEGDWVTNRAADAYEEGISDYTPAAGYKYTPDGFQTITADFTNCNPYVQARTRKAYNLKDNNATKDGYSVSVKFSITEYAYDGGTPGKDQWISITLNSDPIASQGRAQYGAGLCLLIRGSGNGTATALPHYADKQNNLFTNFAVQVINPTVNEETGKEEYTFTVKYDGTNYVMNVCGYEFTDETLNTILNEQCADGAYVGVSLMTTEIETPASLLITEFQGEVPFGDDSLDPEPNVKSFAEIADSNTVEAGKPAVMWDGKLEQQDKMSISGADYTIQENGVVSLKANNDMPYISFNLKNDISYEAADFPVIAVLTKDCWTSDGQIYYMSGRTLGANSACMQDIFVDEYQIGEGWAMAILDLTEDPDWAGRINGIRVDFKGIDYEDEQFGKFDVAYIAAFRTIADAEQYYKDYLTALLGKMPETDAPTTEAPTTEAPTTEAPDQNDATDAPSEGATTEAQQASGGCGSVVAVPVVALIAMLGVAFVAKKKD